MFYTKIWKFLFDKDTRPRWDNPGRAAPQPSVSASFHPALGQSCALMVLFLLQALVKSFSSFLQVLAGHSWHHPGHWSFLWVMLFPLFPGAKHPFFPPLSIPQQPQCPGHPSGFTNTLINSKPLFFPGTVTELAT